MDLLSMDDLTVSDPSPPPAPVAAGSTAAAGIAPGGDINDLFGGGGVAALPAVQKQVSRSFRF